jgi:DnaJ-class molecular chaperone
MEIKFKNTEVAVKYCERCNGDGIQELEVCPSCNGLGFKVLTKDVIRVRRWLRED